MRSSARLTEGFTITLENLPGLWAEDAGVVQTPDELHLDPIAPPRTPRRFVVKIQTGQQPVVLDLIFEPCTLDGWRTAWCGRIGGLKAVFAVRQPPPDRGEGYLHFAYEPVEGASARAEREAVDALLALQRPGNVTIEEYTGERFALPPTIDQKQGNLIVSVADLIRTRDFEGDVGFEYVMAADRDVRPPRGEGDRVVRPDGLAGPPGVHRARLRTRSRPGSGRMRVAALPRR